MSVIPSNLPTYLPTYLHAGKRDGLKRKEEPK